MLQLRAVGATSTDDSHPAEHSLDGYEALEVISVVAVGRARGHYMPAVSRTQESSYVLAHYRAVPSRVGLVSPVGYQDIRSARQMLQWYIYQPLVEGEIVIMLSAVGQMSLQNSTQERPEQFTELVKSGS